MIKVIEAESRMAVVRGWEEAVTGIKSFSYAV